MTTATTTVGETAQLAAIARIDAAFERLNSLLDASGCLDSEPMQRATYALRLEIARAAGDDERAMAAECCLKELVPAPDSAEHSDK